MSWYIRKVEETNTYYEVVESKTTRNIAYIERDIKATRKETAHITAEAVRVKELVGWREMTDLEQRLFDGRVTERLGEEDED